jgi:exosome complex RNA-binding protein Rrp42 (RNase PH superfamily)
MTSSPAALSYVVFFFCFVVVVVVVFFLTHPLLLRVVHHQGVVDSHILLDPSIAEEKAAQSNLMVAIMPSANEITQMLQTGEIEHTKAPEVHARTLTRPTAHAPARTHGTVRRWR